MPTFDKDPRLIQSANAAPLLDAIYREHLGAKSVERQDGARTEAERAERLALDRRRGVDVWARLGNGMSLYVSEKALSASDHNTITIEHLQNVSTGERGDWYRISADVYAVAYLSEDKTALSRWMLLDLSALKLASARGILWSDNRNRDGKAKASFRHIEANQLFELAPHAVIAQSGMMTEANVARLAKLRRAIEGVWDGSFDDWSEAT